MSSANGPIYPEFIIGSISSRNIVAHPNSNSTTLTYDANGNMTYRVEVVGAGTATWIYDYNDANRLWKIRKVSGSCGTPGTHLLKWIFTYDGDGVRVKEDYFNGSTSVITLYFAGGMYEVLQKPGESEIITRYYGIAGQRVAIYDGSDLEYMLTDAQGSVVVH